MVVKRVWSDQRTVRWSVVYDAALATGRKGVSRWREGGEVVLVVDHAVRCSFVRA